MPIQYLTASVMVTHLRLDGKDDYEKIFIVAFFIEFCGSKSWLIGLDLELNFLAACFFIILGCACC